MGYRAEIGKVVAANVENVRGDLDRAREALQRTRAEVHRLERLVVSLEVLLELAGDKAVSATESSTLTLHEAMAAVLRSVPEGMLRAGELAAEIDRRRLYKMRDGRPVETQQIHARVGHYPNLFTKKGTFIKLVHRVE